jgi:hypothetical protein
MQLFTYNITDLISFDSPVAEVCLERDELPEFGMQIAREVVTAIPDLILKGMCVAIYDEAGTPISFVPLDTLQ